jgi:hypothetical protein
LHDADTAYWDAFIKNRGMFHANVAHSPRRHTERDKEAKTGRDIRVAEVSIRAARNQLDQISPDLCNKFIILWQRDLVEWRRYLANLDRVESIGNAFRYLNLDYAESPSPSIL